jgi:hypothetical protein
MTNSDKREFENHCLITLKIKLQKNWRQQPIQ